MPEHTPPAGEPATEVDESPAEPGLSTTDPNSTDREERVVATPDTGGFAADRDPNTDDVLGVPGGLQAEPVRRRRGPVLDARQVARQEALAQLAAAETHFERAAAELSLAEAQQSESAAAAARERALIHATLAVAEGR